MKLSVNDVYDMPKDARADNTMLVETDILEAASKSLLIVRQQLVSMGLGKNVSSIRYRFFMTHDGGGIEINVLVTVPAVPGFTEKVEQTNKVSREALTLRHSPRTINKLTVEIVKKLLDDISAEFSRIASQVVPSLEADRTQ